MEVFFCVKSTGKRSGQVGAVMINLRSGLKVEWIDTDLPVNTAGGGLSGFILHIKFLVFHVGLAIGQ
jgi:hypothetical protein